MLSSWQGPASVSYAGSCLTNGAAAGAGTAAIGATAVALENYAEDLEEAQQDAERAIADAREAKSRMEEAERAIGEAQTEAGAARERFDSASTRAAIETLAAPAGGGTAVVEQEQARADTFAAEEREAAARRALERATEDFERAQKRGNLAEERARDAAQAASARVTGAGGTAPVLAMPGAPAGPTVGSGVNPFAGPSGVLGNPWTGVGNDSAVGALQGYAYHRGRTFVSGYTTRRGTVVAPYVRRSPQFARWSRYSRVAGRTTIAFSAVGGATQQLEADYGKDLTTAQRTIRTTAAAGNDAALSWGGAAAGGFAGGRAGGVAGAAVGSVIPGVGTVVGGAVGTVGGTIVGGVVGSGAASLVADHTREFVADTGQAIGDGADSAWDSTAGAREAVSEGFDKVTPW